MKKDTTFKPLNNNVLVTIIEKTVSEGGILLPDGRKLGIGSGTIQDIGEKVYDVYGKEIEVGVKKGDVVFFPINQAIEIQPLSGQFLIPYKALMVKAA